MNKNKFEAFFDGAYLLFDLVAAIIFFMHGHQSIVFTMYGCLALLLGGGDAFHLIPRMKRALSGEDEKTEHALGLGLQVSSMAMTLFYVLLYYIWKQLFGISVPFIYPFIIWLTAIIRIVLCLMPQNNWYHYEGNPRWGIYRNIPFIFTGITMYILFLFSGNAYGYHMQFMSIAIAISFICYLPVVLYAKKHPAVGMLMMPKTLAYVAMLSLGLSLITKIH